MTESRSILHDFLSNFRLENQGALFSSGRGNTQPFEEFLINGKSMPVYRKEFWTAKQRQSSSIHEISYRACFKAQLPRFFIELFSKAGGTVYDPFSGRGTTGIEAALMGRNVVLNDINPLSTMLSRPRFFIPSLSEIEKRLNCINFSRKARAEIDLSMFYHPDTESEIMALKNHLKEKSKGNIEDEIDAWIRMVATNRLTGHSSGFFSVYTLPPNQALSPERQKKVNQELNQTPEHRDTVAIILKKTSSLIRDLSLSDVNNLRRHGQSALFICSDARQTNQILGDSIQLTVTSPPFLDVVQYGADNWLRCWFNDIDVSEIGKQITIAKEIAGWQIFIKEVFKELFRITKVGGWVAFEVGEVRAGKIKLEEYVVPIGIENGFHCESILINEQIFTKTANIWGVKNNAKGTNSNRIVLFRK